mgnify:CR=1 FL=1
MTAEPKDANQDKRHLARILAVQFLFTKFSSEKDSKNYEVFEPNSLLSIIEGKNFNKKLYEKIIDGVIEHKDKIDEIIFKLAPAWPLNQINLVSLIVLRAGIWEAFIGKVTPEKVVINEAIEIEKLLSSQSSSAFINGVLGKILFDKDIQKLLYNLKK